MQLIKFRRQTKLFTFLAVLGFWLVVTAAFTWPLVINLSNTLPDWNDGADSAWRLGSISHQLTTDPLHIYNTRAFYPLPNALTLDELLTGQGLLAAGLIWLFGNPPLAFNILVFLSFMLSGFSMWVLVRHLTGSSGAGLVAGLIFAFSPWHYGQYAHLGLGAQYWMIFALYFLIRFTQQPGLAKPGTVATPPTGRWAKGIDFSRQYGLGYLILFVILFAYQVITAGYLAYFEAILVGFYLVYYFTFGSGLSQWLKHKASKEAHPLERFVPGGRKTLLSQSMLLIGAGVLILVIIFPFVTPFLWTQSQYEFKRDITEVSYWSGSPNSLLRTVDRSWLYKPVQRGVFHLQTSPERMLYPGLITVLLGLASLCTTFFRKSSNNSSSRKLPWLFILLSLCGLVLSFGPRLNLEAYGLMPTGITLPYKWLYENVPGFNALRVPLRFGQLFMLGLAVCAGFGAAWLINNFKPLSLVAKLWQKVLRNKEGVKPVNPVFRPVEKILLIFSILLLVGADFFAPGLPNQPTYTGEKAPSVYQWLASEEARQIIPANALLLELPMGEGKSPVNTKPIYLMYGLLHGRPMLNGSANIIPPGYDRLFNEMQGFPSQQSLDIIEGLGVKFLIVHTSGLPNKASFDELDKRAGPGGRLKKINSFRIRNGNKQYRDIIFRVKKASARFHNLQSIITPDSKVLLADDPDKRYLYTTILPGLVGTDRHYYSTYNTVYNNLGGILPADPKQNYTYSVFYRGDTQKIAQAGFTEKDLVYNDPDNIFQVYHKN